MSRQRVMVIALVVVGLLTFLLSPDDSEDVVMETKAPAARTHPLPGDDPPWVEDLAPVEHYPMPHQPTCHGKDPPHFLLLHIPKSSGTTVLRNLFTYCKDTPEACSFCCSGHRTINALTPEAVSRIEEEKLKQRCVHILMSVRSPVEAIVSAFYESKKWLESPNAERATCNHFECNSDVSYAAMLRRNFTLTEAIHFKPEPFYVRNKMAIYMTDYALGVSEYHVRGTQVLKEMALRRLSRDVNFFFIAERVMEGMALFAAYYGIPWYKYTNQWDWNPYKKLPRSDPLWDEIAHQNSVDMEIYDEVVRMYNLQKERILKELYPRVPANFTCGKAKCTAAPPRCLSECTRKTLWVGEPQTPDKKP